MYLRLKSLSVSWLICAKSLILRRTVRQCWQQKTAATSSRTPRARELASPDASTPRSTSSTTRSGYSYRYFAQNSRAVPTSSGSSDGKQFRQIAYGRTPPSPYSSFTRTLPPEAIGCIKQVIDHSPAPRIETAQPTEMIDLITLPCCIMQQMEPALSESFRKRIILDTPEDCIPHEFLLRALEKHSFEELPQLGCLPKLAPILQALPELLEDHGLLPLLQQLDIDLVAASTALLRAFLLNVLPEISKRPVFLGADRTYMQEITPNSEVSIDDETKHELRWRHGLQGGESEGVSVSLFEDLVAVGRGRDGKEWRGVKYYTREGIAFLEMGLWRAASPLLNLMVKFTQVDHQQHAQLYLRRFEGKRFVAGEIREIKNGAVQLSRMGESLLPVSPPSSLKI